MQQNKSGNMAVVIALIALIVLGAGGFWFITQQKTQPLQPSLVSIETQGEEAVEVGKATSQQVTTADSVKEFTVEGMSFKLSPSEIRVKKGDTVKITFVNNEGFHDFRVDAFKVATKQINKGETDGLEFVADKAGTFDFYCGVGAHRQLGMTGKLIVEE